MMSPSPSPPGAATPRSSGDRPTGATPNAKRPLDPSTIQIANTGVRPMSVEDLAAGFTQLASLQVRDFKSLTSTAEAAHYNSMLLDAVITRLNAVEASAALTAASVGTLTGEAASAVQQLDKLRTDTDLKLRTELDAMMATTDGKFSALANAAAAPAAIPPDARWAEL